MLAGCPVQLSTMQKNILQRALEKGAAAGIPGLTVAIGVGGDLIWQGAAGHSDLIHQEPMAVTSRLGIGSITKTFVARLILQLVGDGQLDFSSPVSAWLDTCLLEGIANADNASIRQLLNHQSGIPNWEEQPGWIREARGERVNPGKMWAKAESLDTVRGLPADFSPGQRYAYSNSNYTLLGLLIERVTGSPLARVLRECLLEPLKLHDTGMDSFDEVPRTVASSYHFATEGYFETAGRCTAFPEVREDLIETTAANLSAEWAAGGMVSTAANLVRWAAALRSGELLTEAMHRECCRYTPPEMTSSTEEEYMLGVLRIRNYLPGIDVLGHGGGTLGFTARMFWLDKHDLIVVLLTNVGEMHCGLRPSPTGAYYTRVLLPAVLENTRVLLPAVLEIPGS